MLDNTSLVPFNRPLFLGSEIEHVKTAIRSGSLGGNGEFTRRCQEFMGQLNGRGKVFLTTSCTSALEMAAIVLDVKPGDEVIVPSYTYVSTINAWLLRGATLVYVDIDPSTMNIDHTLIEAAITPRTRLIVAVHVSSPFLLSDEMRLSTPILQTIYYLVSITSSWGSRYRCWYYMSQVCRSGVRNG